MNSLSAKLSMAWKIVPAELAWKWDDSNRQCQDNCLAPNLGVVSATPLGFRCRYSTPILEGPLFLVFVFWNNYHVVGDLAGTY